MAIEHKDLPESGLHEPKGASLAASNRVYVSDGAGSGNWLRVGANVLQGPLLATDPSGLRVVTDGAGGFATEPTPASSFGTMNLTGNTTTKAVTAATDTTLRTNSDFVEFDLALAFEAVTNMNTGANSLIVQTGGLYVIDFWASIKSNVNATKFSLKFVKNGVTFVSRGPKLTLDSSGQIYNISANGIHDFAALDEIKLFIAADKSCNITIEDMTFSMVYVRT